MKSIEDNASFLLIDRLRMEKKISYDYGVFARLQFSGNDYKLPFSTFLFKTSELVMHY